MKIKIFLACLLLGFLSIALIEFSGCGGGHGGGNNDPCVPANMQFETIELSLTNSFTPPSNRNTSYPPPQYPHMWTGSNPSQILYPTLGLYGGYYCEVRITSQDCIYFHEEYIWDTNQSHMDISVPKNFSFRVKVVFFEVCGDFYNNSSVYYETEWNWVSQEYIHLPSSITAHKFSYVTKKQCV